MGMWEYDMLLQPTLADLLSELDQRDEQGWELVNATPASFSVLDSGEVHYGPTGTWVRTYDPGSFCAFIRRRKQ